MYKQRLYILALLFLSSWSYAQEGEELDKNPAEFRLYFQNLDMDLSYNGTTISTQFDRIGLLIYEESHPWFQPGLHLGYEAVSQSSNPVTSGMDLSGGYLGVMVRSEFFANHYVGADFNVDYTYHYNNKETSTQDATLKWHEVEARLGLILRLSRLHFRVGGYSQQIDGHESASGTITQTRDFEHAGSAGAYGNLDFYLDATGKIGVYAEQGDRESVSIIFARELE